MRKCSGTLALWALASLVPTASFAQLPYAETFDGPDGAAWPTPWTHMSSYVLVTDLSGNRGRLSGLAANGSPDGVARMLLPGFGETDIEAELTLEFEDVANQGIGFYARQNGGTLTEYAPFGQGYAMFLKGGWGWPEDLGIWREVGGDEMQFATGYNPIAGGLQNGVRYRLRFRVTQHAPDSTLIQAKIWPEASSEPGPWTVESFDTQPELQNTPGDFALDIYNFQGTSHIFIDDLLITPYPNTVSVGSRARGPLVSLAPPVPNPVRGSATIACTLPDARFVRVSVFDLSGRRIATVFEGRLDGGTNHLPWNAIDGRGRRLAAGVYLLRLDAGDTRSVRRVVITP